MITFIDTTKESFRTFFFLLPALAPLWSRRPTTEQSDQPILEQTNFFWKRKKQLFNERKKKTLKFVEIFNLRQILTEKLFANLEQAKNFAFARQLQHIRNLRREKEREEQRRKKDKSFHEREEKPAHIVEGDAQLFQATAEANQHHHTLARIGQRDVSPAAMLQFEIIQIKQSIDFFFLFLFSSHLPSIAARGSKVARSHGQQTRVSINRFVFAKNAKISFASLFKEGQRRGRSSDFFSSQQLHQTRRSAKLVVRSLQ